MLSSILAFAMAGTLASVPVEIDGPLRATLTSPDAGAKPPVALILPGSGPTDRDGNNPMGVKAAPYRLLAEALCEQGITTVRADKRGMFASHEAAANANAVFVDKLAADAHLWAADLRKRTGAKCIWLIGHSEGGLVALIAAQDRTDICGLVLIAAPGRKLGDIVREQLKANPANAPILPDALSALAALEKGQDVDVSAFHPALQGLFAPQVQGFWKSILTYDPAKLIKAYDGPVLILQGKTDLQVSLSDAAALKTAQPKASLVELDGVNHVLKTAPLERAANIATYNNPDLPLAPGVAQAIADFIKAR
jgi:uncharacterized protein